MNIPSEAHRLEGHCTCGAVRYRLVTAPLIVHCCHCRWCQRESGSAFAINAMIEADRVEVLQGSPKAVATPSRSGVGQVVWRCEACRIAVWSNYGCSGDRVRVGTLAEPDRLPPDIHIFTASKQPWVVLPPDRPAVAGYYDADQVWSPASLARRAALRARPA